MPDTVNLYEAKTQLSSLVDRAAAGEEIIIAKSGKPRAKLVPIAASVSDRKPSGLLTATFIAEDFDAPLPPDALRGFTGG